LAYGQTTLGELLDKGGKKLLKTEFVAMLPASLSGVWPDGKGEADVMFKPDGTFSGSARHYSSNSTSGSYGTWDMDENGKSCIVEKLPGWNTTHKGCTFRFLLGDQLFSSPSDSDRNAKVFLKGGKKQ
jgi:hypothetical protein